MSLDVWEIDLTNDITNNVLGQPINERKIMRIVKNVVKKYIAGYYKTSYRIFNTFPVSIEIIVEYFDKNLQLKHLKMLIS